jgi:signal transduction histidine kinase
MTVSKTLYENIDELFSRAEKLVDRRSADALPIANELRELAVQNSDNVSLAYADYILAFYKCIVENDYEESIAICQAAMKRMELDGNLSLAYLFEMTMGNAYQFKGEVFSAQECYMNGLRQLESFTESTKREKGFLASFYYNLSLVLGTSQLNIDAEEYLQKAIVLYEETQNLFKLSKSYGALTWLMEQKGEFEKAISNTKKALEIDIQLNDSFSIAVSKANLGILYLRVKRYAEAQEQLDEALNYFSEQKKFYEIGLVKVSMGETLCATNKVDEGIASLHQAEMLFKDLDNKQEWTKIHALLSKYYKQKGNLDAALKHLEIHLDGTKQLYDVEKTNALARAKKEFESEQKEKEKQLLMQKNEEISIYAQKLETSNNELKQFAHVASHDMREPLRMIYTYMTLLQNTLTEKLNPLQTEFISYAIDGAKRLDVLIQDILNLAKVNANPNYQWLHLATVLGEIKISLLALLKDKNAELIIEELPEIEADKTQMTQLFQNLIVNGIKYNRKPNPFVKVSVKDTDKFLVVSIADNGPGIPPEQREKVFEIFQRLSSNRDISGTGMGLAICKKIVESMGGRIWIEGNEPEGTVFLFTLRKKQTQ